MLGFIGMLVAGVSLAVLGAPLLGSCALVAGIACLVVGEGDEGWE